MEDYQYKAFISYSHNDAKWARWLHNALEGYKVHKHLVGESTEAGVIPDKLAPVFLDRAELASATDLGSMLTQSLEQSWCQIVICSPTSANSHWVNEEILTFKRLGRAHRIFSLIVDGEPYASATDTPALECFPPALRFQLDDQGELSDIPAEPIAADVRKGKDGKSNALIKLIAGMLAVGFDVLKQRELQRRHRRLAWLTTSACVGMLVAIGLAVNAYMARNEANKQRIRAEIQAETASRTANFMVSLFAVSDPGEARGNSITAREILDQGARRIETELTEQPVIQATLMNTIGEVYTALGLYKKASDLLTQTVDQRLNLYTQSRISSQDMAESQGALAKVYTELADFDRSVALYQQSIELLSTADVPDPQLQGDLLAGLAEVYFRMGRYPDAEPLLVQVVELRKQAFGTPSLEVADSIQQLGLNYYDLGDLENAEIYLRESLAMLSEILGDEPHPTLAENIGNLAYLMHVNMQFEAAEDSYQEALEMYKLLLGDAHPTVATAYSNLAFLYHDFGEYEKSRDMYQQSIDTLEQVYGASHPMIAKAMNNLAYLYRDMGATAEAEALMQQTVEMAQLSLGEDHADVARYLSTQARWLAESGHFEEAVTIHQRALDIKLKTLEDGHPDIAISQFDLAEALVGVGNYQRAAELATTSVNSLRTSMGEEHWYVAVAQLALAQAYMAQNDPHQAEPLLLSSYQQLSGSPAVPPAYIEKALNRLVTLYTMTNKEQDKQKYQQLLANPGN